jgi:N utilization substance protein A
MQVLIPNALQPAEVEEVILCQMLGRAIVLVREDQLSLAIGKRGQNVRLGSKLCGWDIEIMTREELDEGFERAVGGFASIEGVSEELAERLVGEGFLSYDDLSIIEPDDLMEMGGLTAEQADSIVSEAESRAEEAEQAAAQERRRQRDADRIEAATVAEEQAEVSELAESGTAVVTEAAAEEVSVSEEASAVETPAEPEESWDQNESATAQPSE